MRPWLKKLGLAATSLLVSSVAAELALRAIGYERPSFYTPDPHTGAAHRPGAEGRDRREGDVLVRISEQGLRDRPHAIAKPKGAYRIAVLGDSFAEGLGVEIEQTFWSVAERELAGCARFAGEVEVINFGVSGYGTAQELEALRHRVWPFEPDLVLLAVFSENDVRDNSRVLSKEPLRPYFTLRDGALVPDLSFRDHPSFVFLNGPVARAGYALIDHSRLLQLVNHAKNAWRRRQRMKEDAAPPEGAIYDPLYVPPTDEAWRSAWAVTEALVVKMSREVREHGSAFSVVVLSNPIQVDPDLEARAAAARRRGVEDLYGPERRFEALAKAEGFDLLTLAPSMAEEAARTGVFFHGFPRTRMGVGHWNADGHRAAGLRIAAHLCGP